MTTVHHLTADLNSLLAESKRRNSDIRKACELALADLQSGSSSRSIDSLSNESRSHILEPFLLSCTAGNAKFANIAVPTITKLVLSKLVLVEDLKKLVAALDEASHLAIDIQLRILQCLPTLMQVYGTHITNVLLIDVLTICAALTSNNKSTVVINTASATLQQLFTNVFDKVPLTTTEDATKEVTIDSDQVVKLDDLSYEGYMIFSDLCRLAESEPCEYLKQLHIRQNSALEIVESVINTHQVLFRNHQELSHMLRVKIVPSLLRIVNSSNDFGLVVRTMRILAVLLSSQWEQLVVESEIILSILNHIVVNDENAEWEKILVLEIFNNLFSDFSLIQSIFQAYDAHPQRKNLIQEIMHVLNNYLQKNAYLITDVLQIPSSQQLSLSKPSSVMKITILDHLDKHEPPQSIFRTYPIYLVFQILLLFTDGVAKFVSSLSSASDASRLENEIEFINNIIEKVYPDISFLLNCYIYTLMDNEFFHILIRSLQKFTHTTGLLGLNKLRDDLLILLGQVIIKNESDRTTDEDGNTSILAEQSKNLFALGESIVESFTNSETNVNSSADKGYAAHSRTFNARHITCLRALINLAISLGSTLTDSWKIVWITFQWCDYYINGFNKFSGIKKSQENLATTLSPADLNSIQNSFNKFFESISDYPLESFQALVKELIELSEVAVLKKESKLPLSLCQYNQIYFIDKLYDITKVDSIKFLIDDTKSFELLSEFFIKVGTMRNNQLISPNLKVYVVEKYNQIIKNLTTEGYSGSDNDRKNRTNEICLNGLNLLLNALAANGVTEELLVLNTETEIHLMILNTLYEVIDNCDKNLTKSWDIIFKIINSSFHFNAENSAVKEKATSLIEASFNTLKMILNEFMGTLPIEQFKVLIDTLFNFCEQSFDLNVSFSSISYFWLIGDAVKSKFQESSSTFSIDNEKALVQTISNSTVHDDDFHKCLDIYLMARLITLTNDQRAQVRDGSLQTFFEIIDVHESFFNIKQWNLIFEIIIIKIFEVKDLGVNELKETITLKMDGVISIFTKYRAKFPLKYWRSLFGFFSNVVNLKKLELNIIFFDKFDKFVLVDLAENPESEQIMTEVFEFWIGIPIEYDLTQPELYIDALNRLLRIFQSLYGKVQLDESKVQLVLTNLTKSIKYPIILNRSDDEKPTALQVTVIENFRIIRSNDDRIISSVIRELSGIIVYQFKVRERIESKFKNSNLKQKYKTPTFISIGNLAFELIQEKFKEIRCLDILIEDKTISRLVRALLELIENKAIGNQKDSLLWVSASKFLTTTLTRVFEGSVDDEIWDLSLTSLKACFSCSNKQEELAGIELYDSISKMLVPYMTNETIIERFIDIIYKNSFLYEFNELEQEVMANDDSAKGFFGSAFDETFGTTKPTVFFKFSNIRLHSLKELIKFSNYDRFLDVATKYFVIRVSFTVRRVIQEEKLVYKMPPSIMCERELNLLLQGLAEYLRKSQQGKDASIKNLVNLLVQLIPFSQRYDGSQKPLTDIIATYNALMQK